MHPFIAVLNDMTKNYNPPKRNVQKINSTSSIHLKCEGHGKKFLNALKINDFFKIPINVRVNFICDQFFFIINSIIYMYIYIRYNH